MSRSAEALRALKPDERRALMLKAQGYSYDEIGRQLGWTYTKVNRSITEGRRRFMKVFAAIESGEACEQYVTAIAALAGGTATSAELVAIRPHLRHCTACRATVRALHVPAGTRIKLLLPGFLLAPIASLPDGVKPPEEFATRDHDLTLVPPPDAAAGADAPTGHAIDLAGHLQLPLDLPERTRGIRLGRVKEEAYGLLHRTQSSDVAAGAYIASSTGGGRITTIATIIGFCVSSAGAGALCVATGVVEAPGWIIGQSDRAPAPRPHREAAKPRPDRCSIVRRRRPARRAESASTPLAHPRCQGVPTHSPSQSQIAQATTPAASRTSRPVQNERPGCRVRIRNRTRMPHQCQSPHRAVAPQQPK